MAIPPPPQPIEIRQSIEVPHELAAELGLRRRIIDALRALREIAEHGNSPDGYWHRSRALLALENDVELENAQ